MAAGDPIFAKDLVDALKEKHAANSYKTMVIMRPYFYVLVFLNDSNSKHSALILVPS